MSDRLECAYCSLPVSRAARRAVAGASDRPVYCCYGCRFAAEITSASGESAHPRRVLSALGISIFLTMNVMMFSLALYSQDVYGKDSLGTSALAVNLQAVLRYLSLLLSAPVFVLLGLPILFNSLEQLRVGIVSTDGFVVLGVAASFLYSYLSTLTGSGGVYYETACVILLLMTIGRYLEAQGKSQASAALGQLASLLPQTAKVRRDGKVQVVPLKALRPGDGVIVRPGGRIPVDGVITDGKAHVDEQVLTGESALVTKESGCRVLAGTLNTDGFLEVAVTAVAESSTLSRLVSLVDDARRSKGRYERMADRTARVFVPVILLLSVTSGLYHAGGSDASQGLMVGLAVLLISCPCALGVATPLAVWAALAQAAQRGILFRKGDALEQLAAVRAIAFDKTGTLTTGTPSPRGWAEEIEQSERSGVLGAFAGLAGASEHPYSAGLKQFLDCEGVVSEPLSEVRSIAGVGMQGTWRGRAVRLGGAALVESLRGPISRGLREAVDGSLSRGEGLVCLAVDERLVAVCSLGEQLREDACAAVAELRELGCRVEVLTGDHPRRGETVASALGVEVRAGLLPEDKARRLGELRREAGPVAMVGDGLNDAPAMVSADAGIAMGCGADLTREAAQVCLLSDNLTGVASALRLARETVRTIRVNLFWAFSYNVVGVGLAMTGRLSPIFAAAAMAMSSLLVVGNSLRLRSSQRSTAAGISESRPADKQSPIALVLPA